MAYQVQLEKFQGPLDVLLQLIEEQQLPISEISLAAVTQQFLRYIKTLQNISPDLLADFLTVASKLIVIKSKSLIPTLEEELEEDEATDLTEQLIQFKKYKEVAKYLQALESKRKIMYFGEGNAHITASFFPDVSVTVSRLHAAMQSLARSLEDITSIPKQVVREIISIKDKIRDLQETLSRKLEFKLFETLKSSSKTEKIVTFLAILELIKERILTVEQEMLFSDITIRRRQDDGDPISPVANT